MIALLKLLKVSHETYIMIHSWHLLNNLYGWGHFSPMPQIQYQTGRELIHLLKTKWFKTLYLYGVEFLTPDSRVMNNWIICMLYPEICLFIIKTDRFVFYSRWFSLTFDMFIAKVGY